MNINLKTLCLTFIWLSSTSYISKAQEALNNSYTELNSGISLDDPLLKTTVDPTNFNFELINAALFHLSNRERTKKGKKPLLYYNDLEKAAKIHSTEMAKHHFFDHINPKNKKYKTPADRIFIFNSDYRTVGENIVANNLIKYTGETLEYTISKRNGTTVYLNSEGKELEYTNYIDLALKLTSQWMNSVPHKKNILNSDYKLVGYYCVLEKTDLFTKIKCTQNFGSLHE